MENQRNFLLITTMVLAAVLYFKWLEFSAPSTLAGQDVEQTQTSTNESQVPLLQANEAPLLSPSLESSPSTSTVTTLPSLTQEPPVLERTGDLIRVETDLVVASINTFGGVIQGLDLKAEPVAVDQPDTGFPLLTKTPEYRLVAQDGLLAHKVETPNHEKTQYRYSALSYQLGAGDKVVVPLTWDAGNGLRYVKTFTFHRDSYVIDIDYDIINGTSEDWHGTIYAQFLSTIPESTGGGFGQLPSFSGAAIYTEEDKYNKISFDDMDDEKSSQISETGWAAMLQHYFVAAWVPKNGGAKDFKTQNLQKGSQPSYLVGYQPKDLTAVAAGASSTISSSVYLGSKEQKHLKQVQKDKSIKGLALTVDYGWLTVIADPLFIALSFIHSIVGNWGWAIILLTILIKAVFYPLSAASYKSMAGMKKLQPRIQTLKERYKDDRQKFQMEMMALYKKEKINPAGGCLPILVQIPVFIALYWVLLESVELRQAPFAMWLQDLSAPDPYYILPVLMGASMWVQQKLNPAAMDDIQRKVMMIMPIALTFLFLSFPQGLVLYWVVNNVLSILQQWLINRKHAT